MSLDPRNMTYKRAPKTPDPDDFSFANDQYSAYIATSPEITVEDTDSPQRRQQVFGVSDIDDDDDDEEEEADSIYTLEVPQQHNDDQLYQLPTHISSHGDVQDPSQMSSPQSTPASPVGTPFREHPSHPLRALTSTNLVLNQQNGTDESLISPSPMAASRLRQAVESDPELEQDTMLPLSQRDEEWAEKGAAKFVKKIPQSNGEDEELVVRRSVKDFKFGKTLGIGSYSTVILATDKNTEKQFAVKVLDKRHIIREKKVKYVNIEKNTLNRLGKRDGIIHLFFTFQDESSLYFVLDYAPNGELLNLIKEHGSLNEDTTRYYSAQLLDAIKYMHDNGVVHRDLKPENILLDSNMKIQVTDFGTAKLLEKNEATDSYPSDTRSKSFVGTAEYVSPELLNEKAVGKACDIWAFGCIVYQMIAGKPPFKATNEYLTFQKIVKLQYAFTAGFPMVIRDLIKKILKLHPKDRLTIKEIQNHLFFAGIDFKNPKESVWNVDPPEAGPYKISAKSMLPVPELSSNNSRTRITIPKRAISAQSTPTQSSESFEESPSQPSPKPGLQSTASSPNISTQPTASQQVLMKAKATVAARKQQQQQRSASGAAGAAALALSRQPNDIIKAYNDAKETKKESKSTEATYTPSSSAGTDSSAAPQQLASAPPIPAAPQSSSSTTEMRMSSNNGGSGNAHITTLRKKPSKINTINKPSVAPPMSKLDLEFVDYLKDPEERVLKKGDINVYLTNVETIEKKFKGRLVDSPLGGNRSNNPSTLLSQVANGSYRGLRNMDKHGEEAEKSIITNHNNKNSDVSDIESFDNYKADSVGSKFKKFFSQNTATTGGNGNNDDDKRNRLLIVTSNARALIFNKLDVENPETKSNLELRTEVTLSHPVIKIKELLASSASTSSMSLFVIESYNAAFVFESSKDEVSSWSQTIFKSRQMFQEKTLQKKLESDPSGAAGTVLGSDAAKSAATIATSPNLSPVDKLESPANILPRISSPPPQATSSISSISKPSPTSNSNPSSNHAKHHGMLKDLVQNRKSGRHSSSGDKMADTSQLYHGLPRTLLSKQGSSPKSSSNTPITGKSKDPLVAAAEAAIQTNPHTTASSSSSSSKSRSNTLNMVNNHSNVPRIITGMNSRLLARSTRKKK